MPTTIHLSVSARGLLNMDRAETEHMMKSCAKDDGTPFRSVAEFRDALMDELAQGHEVLPMSKGCKTFDWKTGCQGCEMESDEVTVPGNREGGEK